MCGTCTSPVTAFYVARIYFTSVGISGSTSCPWLCNPGYFTNPATYGSYGCYQCPTNMWCLYSTTTTCPANSWVGAEQSPSQVNCKCNSGFYGVGGWSTTWQNYPTGTQLEPPAGWSGINCYTCSSGKYQTGTGVTMSSGCLNCVAGSYSTGLGSPALAQCLLCQAGAYSTVLGAPASDRCLICQAGAYSTVLGAPVSAQCLLCQAGSYSTGVGAPTSAQCSSCIAGKYSTFLGATTSALCSLCQAGTYVTGVGSGSSSLCAGCGTGRYSTTLGAVSSGVCLACAGGKFSSNTQAPAVSPKTTLLTHYVHVFLLRVSVPRPVALGDPLFPVVLLDNPAVLRNVVGDLHDIELRKIPSCIIQADLVYHL